MHCLDEIGDLEDYERNGILRNLLDLKAQERDYSVIATLTPKDTKGTCVYCKHCHPCPAGLDIGLINKYYDLSRLGDVLAKERYGCGSAACRYTSPRQDGLFFRKSSANSQLPSGPMWASAPTRFQQIHTSLQFMTT